jgi:hypothetical protein
MLPVDKEGNYVRNDVNSPCQLPPYSFPRQIPFLALCPFDAIMLELVE